MTIRTRKTKSILFVLLPIVYSVCLGTGLAAGPSFDCSKAKKGSVEELICKDDALSAMDQKMATVYAEAVQKAINEHPPVLKAEQRGWIRGRNDCWKSADKRECVDQSYRRRIAELQARYRLVTERGPFWYSFDGDPRKEVVVTFFETEPPTLVAERGDQISLMYLEPSSSGAKYKGRNAAYHSGERGQRRAFSILHNDYQGPAYGRFGEGRKVGHCPGKGDGRCLAH
jgi:uncharacterized protein